MCIKYFAVRRSLKNLAILLSFRQAFYQWDSSSIIVSSSFAAARMSKFKQAEISSLFENR